MPLGSPSLLTPVNPEVLICTIFKKIPPLISHFHVSLPLEPTSLSELFKLTTSSSSLLFSPHPRISAPHHHHSTDIDICLPSVCLQDPLTSTFIPNPAGSFQSLSNLTSAGLDSAHDNYLLGWLLDSLSQSSYVKPLTVSPMLFLGPGSPVLPSWLGGCLTA